MNIAGKMKSAVGKSILIGAFIAFSSAAAWRLCRVSVAWTRRIRPREMPSWSAWMIARTNDADLGRLDAVDHLPERLCARLADPHFAESEPELLDERPFHVLRQLLDRGVEAEAGLDADGKEVEASGSAARISSRRARALKDTTTSGSMKPRRRRQPRGGAGTLRP